MSTILQIPNSEIYLLGLSLIAAAAVNIVLGCMLLLESNNYVYCESPRYLRSRKLTGLSLLVFGVGFLLHCLFMPHFNNLLAGKTLSYFYFHIGGLLLAWSHTSLIDRHYLDRKVVVRDSAILALSLTVYAVNAFVGNAAFIYIGSALFFCHMGLLTSEFYRRFYRIYRQLGRFADFLPNDSDREIRWLSYSCHLIIAFGIGGMLCTVLFRDATLPFAILLLLCIGVFSYIYKALDNFGRVALEVERNLRESEAFVKNDMPDEARLADIEQRVEQWVAKRYYADPLLTFSDTLEQMGVSESTLNYYLDHHTTAQGYRQWLLYLRVEEAKRLLLQHPDYSMDSVAAECGYSSGSTLARAFRLREGLSPLEWRIKASATGEA